MAILITLMWGIHINKINITSLQYVNWSNKHVEYFERGNIHLLFNFQVLERIREQRLSENSEGPQWVHNDSTTEHCQVPCY